MNSETAATLSKLLSHEKLVAGLKGRYGSERHFKASCVLALSLAVLFLALLFGSIIAKGHSAFEQTQVRLDIFLDPEQLSPEGRPTVESLSDANYTALIRASIRGLFPEVTDRRGKRALGRLISGGGNFDLREIVTEDPSLVGQTISVWFAAADDIDMLAKGHIDRNVEESERRVSDLEIEWVDALIAMGRVDQRFNLSFFQNGDSREPEMAGIWGAAMGSFYTMVVTLLLSFPLGIASAIYLEEFAPENRWTDLIEVNVNNLAAVPSIVFGLLGLAVFLNFFNLPRSAPFVGGLVLTLMTLPTIIIAARAAIKSIPPSIREAAYGLGASPMQVTFHHVLPLALPGILTGTIIGMARALGETAPLLMIGMVAFIVDVPGGFFDPSTVLPVQVYLWADSPERAFVEKTSGAILVLLAFLIVMNLTAVILRKRSERRW